jgi:hypothetical protein
MADGPEVLPPSNCPIERRKAMDAADNALAIVRRLARTQHLPAELIAVLDGPLADAVAVAADYVATPSPRRPMPPIWARH